MDIAFGRTTPAPPCGKKSINKRFLLRARETKQEAGAAEPAPKKIGEHPHAGHQRTERTRISTSARFRGRSVLAATTWHLRLRHHSKTPGITPMTSRHPICRARHCSSALLVGRHFQTSSLANHRRRVKNSNAQAVLFKQTRLRRGFPVPMPHRTRCLGALLVLLDLRSVRPLRRPREKL